MNLCRFSVKPPLCDNIETKITCEHELFNVSCRDSMSFFIIEGYYGRTDENE